MTNEKHLSRTPLNRRQILGCLATVGVGTTGFQRALAAQADGQTQITAEMIAQAEWISEIELSAEERESVARSLNRNREHSRQLRDVSIDADTVPALVFRPDFFYRSAANELELLATESAREQPSQPPSDLQVNWSADPQVESLPDEELAFAGIHQQASLLSAGKISSRELTQLYVNRLRQYDPILKCVVELLEEHALKQAVASDARRRAGGNRGVLDGIPWVAKDLIAIPPWKTTWGAEPFQDQLRPQTATVAKKMEQSGAILLAKVSLGALAWGDEWFGGKTRNPWNPQQGSSGSSAGSAASVAAGLASFGLGSETLGSIVSPCRRCRTCGLRGTFGRVSRAGCMPLAWSMDKIGPIARRVDDLAYVFQALLGADGKDPTVVERSFHWPVDTSMAGLRIGVGKQALSEVEQQGLDILTTAGATAVDLDLTSDLPVGAMNFILGVEASTVFDDAFRGEPQANYGLWPSTFRSSQFIPAIQYLRANRMRGQLIAETERKLLQVDVVLGGEDLLLTNLTGHPSLVLACGTEQIDGIAMPGVVKLTAAAYREERLLHVAQMLQLAMPPSPARPDLDNA